MIGVNDFRELVSNSLFEIAVRIERLIKPETIVKLSHKVT